MNNTSNISSVKNTYDNLKQTNDNEKQTKSFGLFLHVIIRNWCQLLPLCFGRLGCEVAQSEASWMENENEWRKTRAQGGKTNKPNQTKLNNFAQVLNYTHFRIRLIDCKTKKNKEQPISTNLTKTTTTTTTTENVIHIQLCFILKNVIPNYCFSNWLTHVEWTHNSGGGGDGVDGHAFALETTAIKNQLRMNNTVD